jgi:hypothetical protein
MRCGAAHLCCGVLLCLQVKRWCPSMPVLEYHGKGAKARAELRQKHMPLGEAACSAWVDCQQIYIFCLFSWLVELNVLHPAHPVLRTASILCRNIDFST